MNNKSTSNVITIIILTTLVLGIISIQDCDDSTNRQKKEVVVTNTDKKEDKTNEKKDSKKSKDNKKKTDSKSSNSKNKKTTKSTEKKTKTTVKYTTISNVKVTAYCSCTSCSGKWGTQTSTGTTCTQGRTIAVDPSVIPLGSKVEIDGHTYTAEDTGGNVKGKHIDIYFVSHTATNAWGVKYKNVKVYKK